MNFVCGTCGYVVLEGDAPDNCPVCNSPKDVFAENGIINTSESEGPGEKHLPVISIVKNCNLVGDGCLDVNARIGSVLHPMEADHFIVWVDFYVNKEWVMRSHLSPGCNPAASAHIKLADGSIEVVEFCNKHGYWLSEANL